MSVKKRNGDRVRRRFPPTHKTLVAAGLTKDGRCRVILHEEAPWCFYEQTIALHFNAEELFRLALAKLYQAGEGI